MDDAGALPDVEVDVAVVGAGQAGLSAGYFLRRAGFRPDEGFVVLDHSPAPGGAWQYRWPSLTYAKAHRVHDLPGLPLEGGDPDRPSAEVVGAYFARYESAFDLRVHRPVDVTAVREGDSGRLRVESGAGVWSARALINATGTWDRPFLPYYSGQETFLGRQLHTAGYRGAAEFAGRHVVVVGGGTSAVQLLMEVAEVARTTWVTRRPPVFRSMPFTEDWGRSAVALVEDRVRRGLPPQSVVSVTGLAATEAVLDAQARGVLRRQPMFDRITPHGVAWNDGRALDADVILWATGFRRRARPPGPAAAARARGRDTHRGHPSGQGSADSPDRLRSFGEHHRCQPRRAHRRAGRPRPAQPDPRGAGHPGRGGALRRLAVAGGLPLRTRHP
jgi:cation diffusion facilitator CzcD-associated flavoprotein CzcO